MNKLIPLGIVLALAFTASTFALREWHTRQYLYELQSAHATFFYDVVLAESEAQLSLCKNPGDFIVYSVQFGREWSMFGASCSPTHAGDAIVVMEPAQ